MSTATADNVRSKRKDVPAKIDKYVLRLAKILAAHDDVGIAELMSDTLEPIFLERMKKERIPIPPKPKDDAT